MSYEKPAGRVAEAGFDTFDASWSIRPVTVTASQVGLLENRNRDIDIGRITESHPYRRDHVTLLVTSAGGAGSISMTRRQEEVAMQRRAEDATRLAERFEEHRARLRAVAYRMLGSLPDADDAVQDAWVRFSQSDVDSVDNLGGFLTTIVARVCLSKMRARKIRPEDPMGVHVPDPVVSSEDGTDPETEALLADSVGLALVVVLETLAPAERLAFVLHDLFDVPFSEIAPMIRRSTAAARQLASRARRQVHAAGYRAPDTDRPAQRALVDAFFTAARGGDLGTLAVLLDPDVVLRADGGAARPQASAVLHGPTAVARRAATFIRPMFQVHPMLVNGAAGAVLTYEGQPIALLGFTIAAGRITAIDAITDPSRLSQFDLSFNSA